MKIFYIAPHYFDSGFDNKLSKLKEIASKYNFEILKGIKSDDNNFDLENTMELYKIAHKYIADLSFERPSCYYELGFLQGQNKDVFLIALEGTIIHQKIGEVKFYKNIDDYELLMEKILTQIKNTA